MKPTGSGVLKHKFAGLLAAGLLFAAWTAGAAPVIRSGAEPDYPPLCFVDQYDTADGFSVELLREALAAMGRKVSFETAPWAELKQKLADGELDVLPLVGRTPEREALYDFTVPYLTLHGALFVHQDETAIRSLADLPGKTIAVMKGDNAEEYVLREKLSERVVSTSTFEEAFELLSRGEADAVIAQKLMGVTLLKKAGIPDVRVTGQPNEEFKQHFCFAVPKGNQALLSILNEGLALTIQDGTQQRLKQKWLGTPFYDTALARPLVYGGDRAFPPYEYLDENGDPAGFNIEIARALARELGVEISFQLEPWSEIRRKMDAGAIDLAAMFYSESRDRTADFSTPITASEQVVFARAGSPAYSGLDSLRGRRISVQSGDLAHDYLLENGFSEELVVTQTPQGALRLLADGEVDFSLSALLQGRYWIHKNGWKHIVEVERSLLTTDYCFAVSEGKTALLSRINEGLLLLKQSQEYRHIYNEWLGILGSGMDWEQLRRLLIIIGGALLLTAGVVLWFVLLLRRQVRKKTAELRTANQELDLANTEALSGMEEALRANEKLELTQFALDSSSDTVFWIAPDGHFIFVNQAACDRLGYSRDELLSMSVADIDPDFPAERWPQHWQAMQENRSMRFESHHQTKEGHIFPVEIFGSFVSREDEEYIFAFVHDITARKEQQQELEEVNCRLEENNHELQAARQAALNMMQDAVQAKEHLEKSKENLRITLRSIGDAVISTDMDGRVVSMNPVAESLTGWTEEEAAGKPLNDVFRIIHEQSRRTVESPVDNVLRTGQIVGLANHTLLIAKDGRETPIADSGAPIKNADGETIGVVLVFRDQTKERAAQQALEASEEMMRNSQSVAHICAYSTNLNGSEIEKSQWVCSPEFYKIFGIDETYPHTIAGWADFIHPDFREEVVTYHESVIREKTSFDKEYKIIRIDDGEERWVHGTGELEFDEKGVPVRMHGAIQDITDRKRVEQEMVQQKNLLNESQTAGHIGSWEYDVAEDRITWSDEMYRICGLEIGAPLPGWEEMCSAFPQDWKRLNASVQKTIEEGIPYEEDFRILRPDGTVRWGRVQGSPVKDEDGNVVRLIGTTQDITERKQAQEKIEFEQKLFKSFMDVIPASVYFKDAEGTFINVNKAKCRELDRPAEEIIGKSDADFLPEDQTERSRKDELRVMETEQLLEFEDRSHERWFFSTKAPRHDENGNVIGILGISWDITARKLAEADLRESREELEAMWNTMDVGIALIDAETRNILSVNPALLEISGYSEDELLDHVCQDVICPACQDECPIADLHQILDHAERELKHKEGRLVPIEKSVTPITLQGREVYVETIVDITNIKQAEQQIRFEQTLFTSVMDSLPAMVFFKDLDGRYIRANRKKCEQLGVPEDQLLGKTVYDFFPEELAETYDAQEIGLMQNEQSIQMEHPHGNQWYYTIKAPHYDKDGNLAGTFCISWEITDRKQAETELLRLSTAIEQSPETVVITDTEGTIEYVNPAFETVTGYTKAEAIGQNPRILKSGQQDEAFYSEMWKTLEAGEIWNGRMVNKRKDGTLYTEDASIAPVKDKTGTITHFVGVKRDVTVELAQEEQMQNMQKMEAVGQLAGGIAHDFNNILQAIMGFSELLLMQLDPSNDTSHKHVQEIQKAAGHAADLTRQMLIFSRKQEVSFKSDNLNDAVQNTKPLVKSVLGEKIRMKLRVNPTLLPVNIDRQQLERCIMNMALNARDAMPDGGTLTLQTQSATFSAEEAAALPDARPGRFACLSIADTGAGIPKEAVEHIFEPFFTTKEPGKGTGLGLAAIYGIVQEHKGWVNVYSEPGEGTTFKIYLPFHENSSLANPSAARVKPLESKGAGERILMVEDDPSIRTLTEKALTTAGYQVESTPNAEEAVKRFYTSDHSFSLLISDVILPGQNGAELAAELFKKTPNLPVILCSGYSGDRIKQTGIHPDDFFFLEKPFQIADLLDLVHNILKGGR